MSQPIDSSDANRSVPDVAAASQADTGLSPVVVPKSTNPYPGLRPFEEEDSALFFGRVQHISDLLSRLRSNRFLAVIGVSGSGKSSLVRAGLIPVLRQGFLAGAGERWRTILLRPGKVPVSAIAIKLDETFGPTCRAKEVLEDSCGGILEIANRYLDLRENLLIVVDQFEEVFRYKHLISNDRPEERIHAVAQASAFVSLLLNAIEDDRCHVIITMRSDYLGDCAQFQGLPEQLNKGQYLISRLSPDEQREIIVRPVWTRHAKISELLVQRLLDDVGSEPQELPVLQHVLSRIWKDWENRGSEGVIGVSNLDNVGGFDNAMDWHAEDVYKTLPSQDHKWIVKRLFQRITLKGTSEHPIRRAETLADIRSVIADLGQDVDQILRDVIVRMRERDVGFLTSPEVGELKEDSVVDISHESLCWLWKRLKSWVEEEAESAELYARVSKLAKLNRRSSKQQGLYTDPGLNYVLQTYHPGEVSHHDPDRIDPWSKAWSLAYGKSWGLTHRYLKRSERRKRLVTIGKVGSFALFALCAILFAAVLFITEGKRADEFASRAEFHRAQLGAATQERAALLDIESRKTRSRPSNSDLASWESFDRIVSGASLGHLDADVVRLFVTGNNRIIAIFRPPDAQHVPRPVAFTVNTMKRDDSFVQSLEDMTAVSSSGRYAASACEGSKAKLWDTRSDIRKIFSVDCTNSIAQIEEPKRSDMVRNALQRIVTVENASTTTASVRVLDLNGDGTALFEMKDVPLMAEAISPNGQYIAIALKTETGPVVELRDLSALKRGPETVSPVSESAPIAFSPDGRFLAIGMADGYITLFDFQGHRPPARSILKVRRRSKVKQFPVSALAFSNTIRPRLLAYSEDGYQNIARVVRIEQVGSQIEGEFLWSDYFGRRVGQLVFSPRDTYLGLALDENTARVKIAVTGFETARLTQTGRALSMAFDLSESVAFSSNENHEVVRFPTNAAISPEWAEFGCSEPQGVSISENGGTAVASCVRTDSQSLVQPVVELFRFDSSVKRAGIMPPTSILATGQSFSRKDNKGYLCHTAVSSDGSVVAAQCNEKIEVFDLNGGGNWTVSGDFTRGSPGLKASNECQKIPLAVALNQTGSLLAVGDDCGRVFTYDVDRKKAVTEHSRSALVASKLAALLEHKAMEKSDILRIQNLPTIAWGITSLSFSPDSRTLALGSSFGTLWLEEVSDLQRPLWAQLLDGTIGMMEFSPDSGKLIAAAGGAAYIFNAQDGNQLRRVSELGSIFTAVDFSDNGQLVAAATSNGKIKILDLSFPGPTKIAERFETWLESAAPAADATLSASQTVYALRFGAEKNMDDPAKPGVGILQVWANRDQTLASSDSDERDKSLALTHHNFDIDGRIKSLCSRLREDLVVPPDLSYRSVCGTKEAPPSGVRNSFSGPTKPLASPN
jgi:WD40 repeat protein